MAKSKSGSGSDTQDPAINEPAEYTYIPRTSVKSPPAATCHYTPALAYYVSPAPACYHYRSAHYYHQTYLHNLQPKQPEYVYYPALAPPTQQSDFNCQCDSSMPAYYHHHQHQYQALPAPQYAYNVYDYTVPNVPSYAKPKPKVKDEVLMSDKKVKDGTMPWYGRTAREVEEDDYILQRYAKEDKDKRSNVAACSPSKRDTRSYHSTRSRSRSRSTLVEVEVRHGRSDSKTRGSDEKGSKGPQMDTKGVEPRGKDSDQYWVVHREGDTQAYPLGTIRANFEGTWRVDGRGWPYLEEKK